MDKIDAVITYVNMDDPEWKDIYNKFIQDHDIPNKIINSNIRFRDYGVLKACLRSIDQYMPWINNIFLVVSSESQVPKWINRQNVKVIYHKDIIPEKYLPTFNTNTIELHLHNIKELSEKFIYFNDDMLLISNNDPLEYFIGDKIVHYMTERNNKIVGGTDEFYRQLRHTNVEVLYNLGYSIDLNKVYYNSHGPTPMLKSENQLIYNKLDLDLHTTPFRETCNLTQELFTLFMKCRRKLVLSKNATNRNLNCSWDKYGNYTPKKHKQLKQHLFCDLLFGLSTYCVNDVFVNKNVKDMSFVIDEIKQLLELRFPNLSKYEIKDETNNISQTIPEAGSERNTSI